MAEQKCAACEALPLPFPEPGCLYMTLPLGHSAAKVRRSLESARLEWSEPFDDVLAVRFDAAGRDWTLDLGNVLSELELEHARGLITKEDALVSFGEMLRMRSLRTIIGQIHGRWLVELIAEQRLVTWFQPIVHTQATSEIFAYECLVRGENKDGTLISPGRLYDVARQSDMLFHLDRASRLCHIRNVIRHEVQTNVFINFNPTAIYDPEYCLKTTVQAIRRSKLVPSRIVFEVVESDEVDAKRLPKIVDFYRREGFRVALDDLGAGFSSLNLLSTLRPDFVKLDMELVRNVDTDSYKASVARKLLEMAGELGVETVAEGIETAGEAQWLAEYGATYLQGYFFAKPAPIPPVFQASAEQSRELASTS